MHCMHIINAILNYKKCNLNYREAIFGWERLCIVDGRFYFDEGDFVPIQSLRGKLHISKGETLFRGRLYFVTPADSLQMAMVDGVWSLNGVEGARGPIWRKV